MGVFREFGPRGDGARAVLSLMSVESFRTLRSRAINPRRRGCVEVGVPGTEEDTGSSRVGVTAEGASGVLVGLDLGRSEAGGVRVFGFACVCSAAGGVEASITYGEISSPIGIGARVLKLPVNFLILWLSLDCACCCS
jgi:hypothetical protein